MSADENRAVARRYFEGVNQGSLAYLDEVCARDIVLNFPGLPGPVHGVEGVRQVFTTYLTAFPDMHQTVEAMLAEGDRVAVRWRAQGTQTGPLAGPGGSLPATGRQAIVTGINIVRIADGRIVEDSSEFDALGMLQQLGAVPTPGQAQPV